MQRMEGKDAEPRREGKDIEPSREGKDIEPSREERGAGERHRAGLIDTYRKTP